MTRSGSTSRASTARGVAITGVPLAIASNKLLLDSRIYHAIATHDEAMIKAAKDYAAVKGMPKDRFEFQMLFGVRRDLQQRLAREGYQVRTYIPYGRRWYPYFMRRLAERPANVAFILRNFFRG